MKRRDPHIVREEPASKRKKLQNKGALTNVTYALELVRQVDISELSSIPLPILEELLQTCQNLVSTKVHAVAKFVPSEIWYQIISLSVLYANTSPSQQGKDLLSLGTVCTDWNNIVQTLFKALFYHLKESADPFLLRFPETDSLSLYPAHLVSDRSLTKLTNLTVLDICGSQTIFPETIANMTSLRALYLFEEEGTPLQNINLSSLTNLEFLRTGVQVDPNMILPKLQGFSFIGQLSSLPDISRQFPNLSQLSIFLDEGEDREFFSVERTTLTSLQLLGASHTLPFHQFQTLYPNLQHFGFFLSSAIPPIQPLTGLTSLDIQCHSFDLAVLDRTVCITRIRSLSMNEIVCPAENLRKFSALLHLKMRQVSISEIPFLTGLRSLEAKLPIALEDFSVLQTFTDLTSLSLVGNFGCCQSLSDLTNLKTLKLETSEIQTNILRDVTSLTWLDLRSQIAMPVELLTGLTKLIYLFLPFDGKTNKEIIRHFKTLRPQTRIYLDSRWVESQRDFFHWCLNNPPK